MFLWVYVSKSDFLGLRKGARPFSQYNLTHEEYNITIVLI